MRTLINTILLSLVTSCTLGQEVQQALAEQQKQLKILAAKVEALDKQLANSITLISCPQDIQQLFERVRGECSKAGVCNTAVIKAADSQLDADRRHRFFRYIRSNFIHEVIYIAHKQTIPLLELRQERLARFAGLPRFKNTHFLIIASDHLNPLDGYERAKVVTDELIKNGISEALIDVWPYSLKNAKSDSQSWRTIDKYQFGEPQDLLLGVWIFRVEC